MHVPIYLHCVGRDNFTFNLPTGQEVTEVYRKVLRDEFHNFVLLLVLLSEQIKKLKGRTCPICATWPVRTCCHILILFR
jgi:hypothetical protein